MKMHVLRDHLKSALTMVNKTVPNKSTLPVLTHVLLQTDGDVLVLASTNLEAAVRVRIPSRIERPGATTVPAKLLTEMIAGLENDTVTFDLDGATQTTTITSARRKVTLKGIEADEFPTIPMYTGTPIDLPLGTFTQMVQRVVPAAAIDDTRPVLAGVLVRTHQQTLTLAAADGFRLAVDRETFDGIPTIDTIIPARNLGIVSGLTGETITLVHTDSGVLFRAGNTEITTRGIFGTFPDFDRILPTDYATRVIVDTDALVGDVRMAAKLAADSAARLRLSVHDDALTLQSSSAETGTYTSTIPCAADGGTIDIMVNAKYFLDAVLCAKGNGTAVSLAFQTERSPVVVRSVGRETYQHVVMPVTR